MLVYINYDLRNLKLLGYVQIAKYNLLINKTDKNIIILGCIYTYIYQTVK